MDTVLLVVLIVLFLVGGTALTVANVRYARRLRHTRALPPFSESESVADAMERWIAVTRADENPWGRGYVLGTLQGLYESGRLDEEEYVRLSASVVDWIVDAGGVSVASRIRRRRWSLRA